MQLLNTENRSIARKSLPLPVHVEVRDSPTESWSETTEMRDVSAMGGGFRINRPIKRGRIALLSMAMPKELRKFDLHEEQYRVWTIVRRCVEISMLRRDPYYVIGGAFIGKFPPPDYLHSPNDLYDLAEEQPSSDGFWRINRHRSSARADSGLKDSRRHTRLDIPEAFLLEVTDADGRVSASEFTVTENISVGGALMFTQLDVDPGTLLRATCRRTNETIISIVRGKAVGPDGLMRLHLEFVDKSFPLDGLS
ncbi:MAG: hypothetical protein ABJA02_13000 [Acidobacteriota bacterium]